MRGEGQEDKVKGSGKTKEKRVGVRGCDVREDKHSRRAVEGVAISHREGCAGASGWSGRAPLAALGARRAPRNVALWLLGKVARPGFQWWGGGATQGKERKF